MITNGESISYVGKYHNIKLIMGGYKLSTTVYAILIGRVDLFLGVEWLKMLGTFFMNLEELFVRFNIDGQQYQL